MQRAAGNKQGASMIWVLCLMAVVFLIGTSVLTAAAMAGGIADRYRAAKTCYYYTKSLHEVLEREITGFTMEESNPWYALAQGVYRANSNGAPEEAAIGEIALTVDFGSFADGDMPITEMEIFPENTIIIPSANRIEFDMIMTLRTNYRDQKYVVTVRYHFSGTYQDMAGTVTAGQYICQGPWED